MPGKHSRPRFFRSPVGIVSTAAVGVALAVGGTVGAVHLAAQPTEVAAPLPTVESSSASPSPTDVPVSPSPSASASASPSAKASASPQRASRSKTRTAAPKPTATRKATTSSSTVVSSGTCGASFYDEGQMTANGETFNPDALTAASKTLAFNTRVRVINPSTGKSVVVRINDRGPYVDGRCLDLSRAAFATIASVDQGELTVKYEVLT